MMSISLQMLLIPMISIILWDRSIYIYTQASPKYSFKLSIGYIKRILTLNNPLLSFLLWNLHSSIFVILAACEGALGLALMESIVRTHGNHQYNIFNSLQC